MFHPSAFRFSLAPHSIPSFLMFLTLTSSLLSTPFFPYIPHFFPIALPTLSLLHPSLYPFFLHFLLPSLLSCQPVSSVPICSSHPPFPSFRPLIHLLILPFLHLLPIYSPSSLSRVPINSSFPSLYVPFTTPFSPLRPSPCSLSAFSFWFFFSSFSPCFLFSVYFPPPPPSFPSCPYMFTHSLVYVPHSSFSPFP